MGKSPIKVVFQGINKILKPARDAMKQIRKVSKVAKQAGRAMTVGFTLPFVLGMGKVAATAAQFDFAMNRIEARVTLVGKTMEDLRNQAKLLGATTRYSASQVAEGMELLALGGFNSLEIFQAIPHVLNLATIANVDLAQSSDSLITIMRGMGLEASQMGEAVDIISTALNKANMKLEEFTEMSQYAAPVAKEFGMSLKELTIMSGFLHNLGIKGSMAGTTMRNMMLRLGAQTPETEAALKKLGISVIDETGNFKKMTDIVQELSGAMSGMTNKKEIWTAFKDVFGRRAVSGAMGAVADIKKAKSGLKGLSEVMVDVTGNGQRTVDIMNRGAIGAWNSLKSAGEAVMIALGESGLLDVLTKIANGLASILRWLSKVSPLLLQFLMIVGMVVAAMGPFLLIFGSLAGAFASLISASVALGVSLGMMGAIVAGVASGVGIILVGIGLLIGAFILIKSTLDPLLEKFGWLKKLFMFNLLPLKQVWELFGKLGHILGKMMPLIRLFLGVFTLINGVFMAVASAPIMAFLSGMLWVLNRIVDALDMAFSLVGKLAKAALPEWAEKALGLSGQVHESNFFQTQASDWGIGGLGHVDPAVTTLPRQEQKLSISLSGLPKGVKATVSGGGNTTVDVAHGPLGV